MPPLSKSCGQNDCNDDDEEDLPTKVIGVPSHEPLVLWRDPNDASNVIEVLDMICLDFSPCSRISASIQPFPS